MNDNATQTSLIVEAQNLRKSYPVAGGGNLLVLSGLDLEVRQAETVAITGESGSGKSTILSLLGGLEVPTAGSLRVGNTDLSTAQESELAEFRSHGVGIVFQHFHLMRSLSALENVALPLELREGRLRKGEQLRALTADSRSARERAQEVLAQVGLEARSSHLPTQLSGGECQRVALARALVTNPDLLLADEPTGNLDERTGAVISDLLFDLVAARGATLILVTHSRALAARCARTLTLSNGRLT